MLLVLPAYLRCWWCTAGAVEAAQFRFKTDIEKHLFTRTLQDLPKVKPILHRNPPATDPAVTSPPNWNPLDTHRQKIPSVSQRGVLFHHGLTNTELFRRRERNKCRQAAPYFWQVFELVMECYCEIVTLPRSGNPIRNEVSGQMAASVIEKAWWFLWRWAFRASSL